MYTLVTCYRYVLWSNTARQTDDSWQIYGGYFLMLLLMLLFCLACRLWQETRVNYAFIFEFDTRHHLDWRQLSEVQFAFDLLIHHEANKSDSLRTSLPFRSHNLAQLPRLHRNRHVHLLAGDPYRRFCNSLVQSIPDTVSPQPSLVCVLDGASWLTCNEGDTNRS